MSLGWNPRFANYARVHGRDPEAQLAHDKARWPGGCMVGFIIWNRARLVEYSRINPAAYTCGHITDHAAYDAWLDGVPVGHGVEKRAA